VDEVLALAKKYGIATPYTSWLVVPDGAVPVVNTKPNGKVPPGVHPLPQALAPGRGGEQPANVADFARKIQEAGPTAPADQGGGLGKARNNLEDAKSAAVPREEADKGEGKALKDAQEKRQTYYQAWQALQRRDREAVQKEKLGVELSCQMNNLRNQCRLEQTAQKRVANNRNCVEVGGVWIDDGYNSKVPTLIVKAMSDAYFRILERHPEVKEDFRLG